MNKIAPIICLDFETGGLSCLKNPITQVALQSFHMDTFESISSYSTYVQPYNDLVIEDQALKATGATMSKINAGITIKEMVKACCVEFDKANKYGATKRPILMGHNIPFDIGFLQYAFTYCKVDISKYLNCTTDAYGNNQPVYLDTMWLTRLKYANEADSMKFNLTACCEKLGVELTDAHSADNDVEATKGAFIRMAQSLRSNGLSGDGGEIKRYRESFQF